VRHGLVQREGVAAVHVRTTLVRQATGSRYELIEAAVGAGLARHTLDIEQVGRSDDCCMKHEPALLLTCAACVVLAALCWAFLKT
jgi:hypothetical protein